MGADLLEEWRQLNHLVDIQVNAWVGYFGDHLRDEFFGYKGGFEGILGSWFFKEFLGLQGSPGAQIRENELYTGARPSGFFQGCQDSSFSGKGARFQGRQPLEE